MKLFITRASATRPPLAPSCSKPGTQAPPGQVQQPLRVGGTPGTDLE